jgi:hypothetical protein
MGELRSIGGQRGGATSTIMACVAVVVACAGCVANVDSGDPALANAEESLEQATTALDRSAGAAQHDASVARAWMNLMMDRVRGEAFNPPIASRAYGYAGVALYEAVYGGMTRTHRSLAQQLNGLPAIDRSGSRGNLDWPAVANGALLVVARELFAGRPSTLAAIDALHREQVAAREAAGVRRSALRASDELGRDVGRAIVRWSRRDGFAETRGRAYTPPVGPQFWVPTGDAPATTLPAEPHWGTLRPFALPSADACAPAPPIAYSEASDSAFFAEALTVYETQLGLVL